MLTLVQDSSSLPTTTALPGTWFQGFCRRLVIQRLEALRLPLEMREAGRVVFAGATEPQARVEVHDPRLWPSVAFDGTDGSGEAYAAGWWTADDLTTVVRLFARSRAELERLDGGMARVFQPLFRVVHALRRNSRAGSRANIHAHYDLGNDFFRRWLDPSMMYSSALFDGPEEDLTTAQHRKLDRLFDLLDLRPGEHLCEIGTGWGELAIRAATRRGVRVTSITISAEQHAHATARIQALGLADRVRVHLCDYRDLQGSFDKLVSVEMIEAVGHHYFPAYFQALGRLLKPSGLAVLQAITIPARDFAAARDRVDFIKRHIFPGCCIPSVQALTAAATRVSDLELVQVSDHAPHYARTLERWRAAFVAAGADLEALGYDAAFRRKWEFYLSYCAGGFAERALGLAHLVYARPGWRPTHAAALLEGSRS
jgi:cyclopropane-fatty-acyl-phospholipid synthase